MWLPYGEEIMIVGRTMWTQSTSVTDRRTDGRTDRITITKTVQRIASHGKNALYKSTFYLLTYLVTSETQLCALYNACIFDPPASGPSWLGEHFPIFEGGEHPNIASNAYRSYFFGTGPHWPPMLFLVFLLVLSLADLRSAKAFSFHNRSSPNFAYT